MKLLLIATLSALIVMVQSCPGDNSRGKLEPDRFGGRRRECDSSICSNHGNCGPDCYCGPGSGNALSNRCQLNRQ
uniref:Putative salivary secreted protein n=1 Tax=Ornithodoros turicata TaxID=34597 RepID=A0A2R5LCB2_9ACAR